MFRVLLCAAVLLHFDAAMAITKYLADSSRTHDVWHVVEDAIVYDNEVHVSLNIHESECFSSSSASSFVVYLGSMSFEGEFLGWFAIPSSEGVRENGLWSFYVITKLLYSPEECFAREEEGCVPAADVIFIQYHNEPEDTMSISLIEVEVEFSLWRGRDNWYNFKYEHTVWNPCGNFMDQNAIYQIGPRIGMFFRLDAAPTPGRWLRDWN